MIPQLVMFCILLLPFSAVALGGSPADRRPLATKVDSSYENITITEDVTWRGNVLVRGSLVVAPQATLRIEPGTVIRFMKSSIIRQTPRLVVMGRLHCIGSAEKPVLFAANFAVNAKGDWGGLLFLSSEKRNQLEHCRIEGAETALQSHFSTLIAKGVAVIRCTSGIMLRDTVATLSGISVSGCTTGLEAHDSEIDLHDAIITDNKKGIAAYRSTLVLASVKAIGNEKEGALAEECRIRFTSCEFASNKVGAFIKGGEGQLQLTRFVKNSETGLNLSGARIKVLRSLFADNRGDGMKVIDGRSSVWSSSFSGNSGYNLANAGLDDFSAVQNWWGINDEAAIMAKLSEAAKNDRSGAIMVAPWLTEKPLALP